jgi:hypothetical protein
LIGSTKAFAFGELTLKTTYETSYEIHLAGILTRLNVEHRTPNIERRIMMTLSHRGVGLMPYGPEAEA